LALTLAASSAHESPPSNVEQLRHVDSAASLDMGPAIFTCRQSSGPPIGIGTHGALVARLLDHGISFDSSRIPDSFVPFAQGSSTYCNLWSKIFELSWGLLYWCAVTVGRISTRACLSAVQKATSFRCSLASDRRLPGSCTFNTSFARNKDTVSMRAWACQMTANSHKDRQRMVSLFPILIFYQY
jgi:hypothetical protein